MQDALQHQQLRHAVLTLPAAGPGSAGRHAAVKGLLQFMAHQSWSCLGTCCPEMLSALAAGAAAAASRAELYAAGSQVHGVLQQSLQKRPKPCGALQVPEAVGSCNRVTCLLVTGQSSHLLFPETPVRPNSAEEHLGRCCTRLRWPSGGHKLFCRWFGYRRGQAVLQQHWLSA